MLKHLFIEKKGNVMIQKRVYEQRVTAVSDKRIKIVKKAKYDEGKSTNPDYFYGIAIYHGSQEVYRPIYPFVRNKGDLDSLKDFINLYETDLLSFYKHGHNYELHPKS